MKKNDVFTFTAPNGVEVTGVVVAVLNSESSELLSTGVLEEVTTFLCYAQNRLFTFIETDSSYGAGFDCIPHSIYSEYGKTLVDYAVLPDYDRMLEDYFHQHDIANDYADKEI